MCTGTMLPLAQLNILSAVSLGSKGTFQRAWKDRALRRTRRVSSVRDPDVKNSGMVPWGENNNTKLHANKCCNVKNIELGTSDVTCGVV